MGDHTILELKGRDRYTNELEISWDVHDIPERRLGIHFDDCGDWFTVAQARQLFDFLQQHLNDETRPQLHQIPLFQEDK